ncbi:hypothetical protein O181_083545 [Austropuccinia psidii MF-1]|uniref:Uncharacterized protein n=1 Tax=Austropuccinia psidii MF-1 TaxID=1389203 RepID=A0A9Q3FTY0_9BASI|nr:hypothetical protein [Austropuccinia psidii MF-1]
MEIVIEEKLVESEDELKLCKHNNGNWEDRYKKGRRFEDVEEGELSENTQRLPGISILEEFNNVYDQICCFSSSTYLFNKNKRITSELPNDCQNQNGIQEEIPEYKGEEDYVILAMITFEDLYDYELDSPIFRTTWIQSSKCLLSGITNHYWNQRKLMESLLEEALWIFSIDNRSTLSQNIVGSRRIESRWFKNLGRNSLLV